MSTIYTRERKEREKNREMKVVGSKLVISQYLKSCEVAKRLCVGMNGNWGVPGAEGGAVLGGTGAEAGGYVTTTVGMKRGREEDPEEVAAMKKQSLETGLHPCVRVFGTCHAGAICQFANMPSGVFVIFWSVGD